MDSAHEHCEHDLFELLCDKFRFKKCSWLALCVFKEARFRFYPSCCCRKGKSWLLGGNFG